MVECQKVTKPIFQEPIFFQSALGVFPTNVTPFSHSFLALHFQTDTFEWVWYESARIKVSFRIGNPTDCCLFWWWISSSIPKANQIGSVYDWYTYTKTYFNFQSTPTSRLEFIWVNRKQSWKKRQKLVFCKK